MTDVVTRAFRRLGRATPFPTTSSFPTTWTMASDGSRSRASEVVSMRSTISARVPVRHARSLEGCSPEQRSCVSATAHSSTSPRER